MKDTAQLLQDILDSITTIETYAVSSYESFLEDEKTQDAVMFNLIIIGEAANRIAGEFQESHPEIPWSSMIGTRNVIVHGYDQVKLQIVWDIIHRDLAPLKEKVSKAI
ncbi:MAG TPA: DUF86 domain-containing protein [Anaerolineaceae bacterium]|jgi:uncharacterized protein with HEPN domain|nr:DUF86 domain-containing protein [Longilinea sp.]HNZ13905.1 DUF86 domain-containing protein [Anaerolineaceae bacterium]HQN43720.1 DUF86 domain-containing protein [Anaerolineaceae bacterium]